MKAVDEVTRALRCRLAEGEWQVGDKFPTFDELMGQYPDVLTNIYRVKLALQPLNEDGLVETVHGSATWVRALPAAPDDGQLAGDMPAGLYEKVKAAAGRHHRSVRAEILTLIERGLEPGPGQPAALLSRHQARPGRRAIVISDLADLHGPASGKVILPKGLFWSPAGSVWDLDDPFTLRTMYQTVLREAFHAADLADWLNGPRLVEEWPRLQLPRGVRHAWEEQHHVLSAASAATAAA
jgi:DNA-binding transcriptional regulator YhcF (GntR family)